MTLRPRVAAVAGVVLALLGGILLAVTLRGAEKGGLLADLSARHEGGAAYRGYSNLGEAAAVADAAIVAEVTDVIPGAAFIDSEEKSTRTEWDDPDADWRTLHMRVRPSEVVSGNLPDGPVTVGISFSGSVPFASAKKDMKSFGPMLLLLIKSPRFAYDKDVWGTLENGGLLGSVTAQGDVSLPLLEPMEAEPMLAGSRSVTAIKAAAEATPAESRPAMRTSPAPAP